MPSHFAQPCCIALIHKTTSSGIQTQDLTVCLYLNFKHGELDHSATTAGSKIQLFPQKWEEIWWKLSLNLILRLHIWLQLHIDLLSNQQFLGNFLGFLISLYGLNPLIESVYVSMASGGDETIVVHKFYDLQIISLIH